jgi:hypothetical protein
MRMSQPVWAVGLRTSPIERFGSSRGRFSARFEAADHALRGSLLLEA